MPIRTATQEDEVTPLTHKLSQTHTMRGFLCCPSYLQPATNLKNSKRPILDLKTSSTTAFPSKIYGSIFTIAAISQVLLHVLSSVCHNFYRLYRYSSTTPFSNTLLKCNTKYCMCPWWSLWGDAYAALYIFSRLWSLLAFHLPILFCSIDGPLHRKQLHCEFSLDVKAAIFL